MGQEREQAKMSTRRGMVAFGGVLAALGMRDRASEAKRKKHGKRKHKKRIPTPLTLFQLKAPQMTGAKEAAPHVGDANASGSAEFTVKSDGTICAEFTFQTTTADSEIILTHIHQGGPTDNGTVVIDFAGQLENCVPVAQGLVDQIQANPAGFYANIHTNKFPDGAVRDQLQLDD